MTSLEIENLEFESLLDIILKRYGYDFNEYSKASLKRRAVYFMNKNNFKNLSEMIPLIIHDEVFFSNLIYDFSITVSEMFRDPFVFKIIREKIIPFLKTYPFIKIWHAGCATGEEVYSMAILLKEEGLYERTQIYATDFNETALKLANEGIFPIEQVQLFTKNYNEASGKNSFSDYYHSKYDHIIMEKSLKKNMTFANHNLVNDSVFGEMNFIICRNVLIYFNNNLQQKVITVLDKSLIFNGFLCLGTKETLQFTHFESQYKIISTEAKIYQKK